MPRQQYRQLTAERNPSRQNGQEQKMAHMLGYNRHAVWSSVSSLVLGSEAESDLQREIVVEKPGSFNSEDIKTRLIQCDGSLSSILGIVFGVYE
ncbi:predicted protein [Sclerotinia sclerotiorum 1980 UF-70]|uniref:Uncharacterized protein n=1 Tax=Sclerotinia sclerotiorum (strain ATCC 18683 / 1980 / Ss-1) TaxID=665079 RepID=A7EBH3_SCLS1|nr:predicted protein [Sclerotinia sclerotiorum 1980 UF-70]EDN99801.1 predicted protein [Sclerotinia sclerotiorum 1980 UF-70]